MRFGVREICNVVLKAKAAQKVGKKIFYKNEPVMYFDTLKTSSMEGQSSTVYAQGGRGNPRLVAWEGERTVTFQMEDALISPEGLSILTGAGLIDAKDKPVYQHITEIIDIAALDLAGNGGTENPYQSMLGGKIRIPLTNDPFLPNDKGEDFAYVMFMKDGEIITEPYIPVHGDFDASSNADGKTIERDEKGNISKYWITVADHANYNLANSYADLGADDGQEHAYKPGEVTPATEGGVEGIILMMFVNSHLSKS